MEEQKYIDLAIACYGDDYDKAKMTLDKYPNIDVNSPILHSPTRGNGTPLILTASSEIGKLLIDKGADINFVYENSGVPITALDSANKELTKQEASDTKKAMAEAYIAFLKDNGAKTYEELQGDKQ
jgi:hypothetical protein